MDSVWVAIISGLLGGGGIAGGIRAIDYWLRHRKRESADAVSEQNRREEELLTRYQEIINELHARVAKLEVLEDQCQERFRQAELEIQKLKQAIGEMDHVRLTAVITADKSGKIVDWNSAAEVLFGWNRDEAMGRNIDIVTPPRLRQDHTNAFKLCVEENRPPRTNTPLVSYAINKIGEEIPVNVLPIAWPAEDGSWQYAAEIKRR